MYEWCYELKTLHQSLVHYNAPLMEVLPCLRSALLAKDPAARIEHVHQRVHTDVEAIHWQVRHAMMGRSVGAELRTATTRQLRLESPESNPIVQQWHPEQSGLSKDEEVRIAHITDECALEIRSIGVEVLDCVLRQGTHVLPLRHLLPANQQAMAFRWGMQHALVRGKELQLDYTEEVNATTLLPLLHEIGHMRRQTQRLFWWHETWLATLQQWENLARIRRRRECAGLQPISGWEGKPVWALQRLHRDMAGQENDAWKFVLETLDAAEGAGFSFGNVYDRSLVEQHIATALWQHRNVYVRDLYIAGGAAAMDHVHDLYVWPTR